MDVDCQSCGWCLEVPTGLVEGSEFACGHCGLLLRNVPATREFRWASLDPFVRRRGASRLGFSAAVIAGLAWIPIVAVAMIATHRVDAPFLAAVALPWCAIALWLALARAGIPRVRWYALAWLGLGAFVSYLAILVAVRPQWRGLLGVGDNPDALTLVFTSGVMAMMVGAAGATAHRLILRHTPTARARPASADPGR